MICFIMIGCQKKESNEATFQPESTSSPTPTPNTIIKNPNDIMLLSFEGGGGDETIYNGSLQSLDLTDAPWNQLMVNPISVSYNTDTGKGYKLPLNNLNDVWYQTLRASTPDKFKTNIYNFKYLRLWVSNVGEGTLTVSVLFSAGMYYYSFLNAENAIVTSSEGNLILVEKAFTVNKFIPEAIEHGKDSVVLPAGFSGWISFPILDKTVNYWTTAPVASLSNATTIDLRIISENKMTEYYVIDDVCLTNNINGTIRSK